MDNKSSVDMLYQMYTKERENASAIMEEYQKKQSEIDALEKLIMSKLEKEDIQVDTSCGVNPTYKTNISALQQGGQLSKLLKDQQLVRHVIGDDIIQGIYSETENAILYGVYSFHSLDAFTRWHYIIYSPISSDKPTECECRHDDGSWKKVCHNMLEQYASQTILSNKYSDYLLKINTAQHNGERDNRDTITNNPSPTDMQSPSKIVLKNGQLVRHKIRDSEWVGMYNQEDDCIMTYESITFVPDGVPPFRYKTVGAFVRGHYQSYGMDKNTTPSSYTFGDRRLECQYQMDNGQWGNI